MHHSRSFGLRMCRCFVCMYVCVSACLNIQLKYSALISNWTWTLPQKRRIYDITNVLEGIGLIEKQSKNNIQVSIHTYVVCVCIYIIYIYIYKHLNVYTYINAYMHADQRDFLYSFVLVRIFMPTCMHACMYINTHTHMLYWHFLYTSSGREGSILRQGMQLKVMQSSKHYRCVFIYVYMHSHTSVQAWMTWEKHLAHFWP